MTVDECIEALGGVPKRKIEEFIKKRRIASVPELVILSQEFGLDDPRPPGDASIAVCVANAQPGPSA